MSRDDYSKRICCFHHHDCCHAVEQPQPRGRGGMFVRFTDSLRKPFLVKRTPLARGAKRIRPVSKRKAKTRTPEKTAYMLAVKELDCCICGRAGPSEAHHCRSDFMARDDWATIPLCSPCHRGPGGYHNAKKSWQRANGPDHGFVQQTQISILGETQ